MKFTILARPRPPEQIGVDDIQALAKNNISTDPAQYRMSLKGKDCENGNTTDYSEEKPAFMKKRKYRPKDFPKRPMSAYNIFFKEMREEILEERKKDMSDSTSWPSMVKEIANRWKDLPAEGRERIENLAKEDSKRYKKEVTTYEEKVVEKLRRERAEYNAKKARVESQESNSSPRLSQENNPRYAESVGLMQEGIVQNLLAIELRALETVRESRVRQLQCLQELPSGGLQVQALKNLEATRRVWGLSAITDENNNIDLDIRQQSNGANALLSSPPNMMALVNARNREALNQERIKLAGEGGRGLLNQDPLLQAVMGAGNLLSAPRGGGLAGLPSTAADQASYLSEISRLESLQRMESERRLLSSLQGLPSHFPAPR